MTIANGSTILANDLSFLTSSSLNVMQADNAQLPLAYPFTFHFRALRAGGTPTPEYARRVRFVAPADLWLDTLTLGVFGMNGTTTATLQQNTTADALAFVPATVSVVGAGAGLTASAARILYDNTRGSVKDAAALALNPVFRTVLKGARMTLQLETTNTLTSEHAWVTLMCRQRYGR